MARQHNAPPDWESAVAPIDAVGALMRAALGAVPYRPVSPRVAESPDPSDYAGPKRSQWITSPNSRFFLSPSSAG